MGKSEPCLGFASVRDAPLHVLEADAIGLAVRNVHDRAAGVSLILHLCRQLIDADFLGAAQIEDFSSGFVEADSGQYPVHDVVDMTETSGLFAGAEDRDRLSS